MNSTVCCNFKNATLQELDIFKILKKLERTSEFPTTAPPNNKNCSLLPGGLSPTFKNKISIIIPAPPISMTNKNESESLVSNKGIGSNLSSRFRLTSR